MESGTFRTPIVPPQASGTLLPQRLSLSSFKAAPLWRSLSLLWGKRQAKREGEDLNPLTFSQLQAAPHCSPGKGGGALL